MGIQRLDGLVVNDNAGRYSRILEAIAEATLVNGKEAAERKEIREYLTKHYPQSSVKSLGDKLTVLQITGYVLRIDEDKLEQFVLTQEGAALVEKKTGKNYEEMYLQRTTEQSYL